MIIEESYKDPHLPDMPKERHHPHQLHPVSDLALLAPPDLRDRGSRKSVTPQPPHLRNNSRASSHGSRRSQEPCVPVNNVIPDQFRENSLNVYLHDVQHLVRRSIVGLPGLLRLFAKLCVWSYKIISLPGGFTKSGNPVLIFPDKAGFSSVSEGDLLILLKYFISVVPGREQVK